MVETLSAQIETERAYCSSFENVGEKILDELYIKHENNTKYYF
jgi:hypothetical protein